MKRTLTYAVVAGLLASGFLALGGDAIAKKSRERLLSEVRIEGVRLSGARIQIDSDVWGVDLQNESTLTLAKKKKKKDEEPEDVGLTCKCSQGSGACSISRNGDQATCNGGECCGWVVISGGPVGGDEGEKIVAP